MTESASAALYIHGPTIRWAEVVREDGTPVLRRFGRRTFDADVMGAIRGEEEGESLDEMAEVVAEGLADSAAPDVSVVVHPLQVYRFFTPVSADLSERDRMRRVVQQAALVTGTRSPEALRITPTSVRTEQNGGDRVEWVHVVAVPTAVNGRMETLVEGLPMEEHSVLVSTEATARLMGVIEGGEGVYAGSGSGPYSLALGQYGTHTEYTLTDTQEWHHSHVTKETRSANQPYYALGFLNRIGVSVRDIGRIYTYGSKGENVAFPMFEDVFGVEARRLDPSRVSFFDTAKVQGETVEALAPCLGAVLEPSSS